MSNPYRLSALAVPESLARQMASYRRRVWRQKMGEAILFAGSVLGGASLLVLAVDRLIDSPASLRTGVLLIVAAAGAAIPWVFYRWVYRRRSPVQLARLMSRRQPRLGDSLLGVLELADDEKEQARSEALCAAAMAQVAEQTTHYDLNDALPPSRLRMGAVGGAVVATLVLTFAIWFPEATANAWARLLLPWRDTPRYTLAAIEPLPDTQVVAHGEPFSITAALSDKSRWRPAAATARVGRQPSVLARRDGNDYHFALQPLREPADITLEIGDARPTIRVIPKLRPELQQIVAQIWLPDYLQRVEPVEQDISGGKVSILAGSRVQLLATADRPLTSARFEQRPISVDARLLTTPEIVVHGDQTLTLEWQDRDGLSGAKPFLAAVAVTEDGRPVVAAKQLPTEQIVLTTTTVPFKFVATDDYGVRRVGYQWRRILADANETGVPTGERLLAAGGPTIERLEADAIFSATQLGIDPGPIELRLFVEDYRRAGSRVYSRPYRLALLTPEEHAAWLGSQLNRWQQRALELRDRELQLHETNRALRALTPEELNRPETRRRLEEQAAAELVGARRLDRLADEGAELIRNAIGNPSIAAEQLEQWAAMLKTLEHIAGERMPSVAELLQQSASARQDHAAPLPPPSAGVVRDQAKPAPTDANSNQPSTDPSPSVVDVESSAVGPESPSSSAAANDPASPGRLTLAETTVQASESDPTQQPTAEAALEEAVGQQDALLDEFQKLTGEINEILANLEGSTLVKRLKAEARQQNATADKIDEQLESTFGRDPATQEQAVQEALTRIAVRQRGASENVAQIIDDMQAYQTRSPMPRFQRVLKAMQAADVVGSLLEVAGQIGSDQGLALATAEYWADALDRWAEELIDPPSSSSSSGGKSAESLPPAIVLEALRILQAEVDLRVATRVAEQARPAVEAPIYRRDANDLAQRQKALADRVELLAKAVALHPDGPQMFPRELSLLAGVHRAMNDAADILARPDTGVAAIAAETEAIERLLASRRINPSGGSGGDAPGGSQGQGEADPALAAVVQGDARGSLRRSSEVVQATGAGGVSLPAEYRAGLDQYFNQLEAAVEILP